MDKEQEATKVKEDVEKVELKSLTDFLSLLIQIDRRINKNNPYEKQDK